MATKAKSVPAPYRDRLSRLRAEIERRKLDGYLVQNRMDQYWLTGFTGEDGFVLVTPNAVVLLTDGRFDEAADIETPWARKVLRKIRTPERTAKEIRRYKPKRVGFDPGHLNVAEYTAFRKHLKPTQLVRASGLILDMRLQKDKGEVAAIRKAIRVAEKAFQKVVRWMRPGVTEQHVAARLGYEMQRLGAQEISFPTIVAAGANASLPHYEAGHAKIRRNEGVLIDWGARVGWYVSDLTRMVWPGSIPREIAKVHGIVKEAHDRAMAFVRPGVKGSAVDRVARQVIEEAGYGPQFSHALGHGIGLDVHEAPRLGKGSDGLLKPGMVVTIEPGIYLPGQGGVRLESDVLVTETGYEVLSTLPY
jgi:Xaa-Pro aminopeptidase